MMKVRIFIIVLLGLFPMYVKAEQLSIEVVKAQLELVSSDNVVVNGKTFKYKLDEKASLYSHSEFDKPAVKLRDLKQGQEYYFELTNTNVNAKNYNGAVVRYISVFPLEDIEEFNKDEDEK